MVYIHSFSPIEQNIYKLVSEKIVSNQLDSKLIYGLPYIEEKLQFASIKTIVYSFLQLEYYKHIDTFRNECERVDMIIKYAKTQNLEKFVVLTYPGAFLNSDNMFLQHKGIIEKKFLDSGIPCTFLNIQAVTHPYQSMHSLHHLFYDKSDAKYVIPQKSNISIYSISIDKLVPLLITACTSNHTGHFDVFDMVLELKEFLLTYSKSIPVVRIPPTFLFLKSYFGKYVSPTMMELFLRPSIPMYSFRSEKEFSISLSYTSKKESGYYQYQDYHVSPVFGTIGFSLST